MATLIDALGGEEVAGSGLQAGATNVSPYWTGSATAAAGVNTGDGALNSIKAVDGFGARVEIGSCVTTATGFGSAVFNANFADARYYWHAQASSGGTFLAVNAGSIVPMVSGVLGLNISGLTFKGAPSTPYSWMAIGL